MIWFDYPTNFENWWTNTTTSSATSYTFTYQAPSIYKINMNPPEERKPEPEPASEDELHDFLFGGADK